MKRTITVGGDFPMKLGDLLRIRGGSEIIEYLVDSQVDDKGRTWEALVTRREAGTNKEPIMGRGEHKIQRLRSNHFPTPEEIYKRMERD